MKTRTLEALDGAWSAPEHPSHVVTRCHALRKVPLEDLGTEDLRLLIAQAIGLRHLLPLAVSLLEDNPYAEGDFYPGDLLEAVAGTRAEDWKTTGPLKARFAVVARRVLADDHPPAALTMSGSTVLGDLSRHV